MRIVLDHPHLPITLHKGGGTEQVDGVGDDADSDHDYFAELFGDDDDGNLKTRVDHAMGMFGTGSGCSVFPVGSPSSPTPTPPPRPETAKHRLTDQDGSFDKQTKNKHRNKHAGQHTTMVSIQD